MRTLAKNKQKMYYALQSGEVPIYETDEDGNIKYITIDGEQVPVETGEYELGYSEPVEFFSSLAMSGGEAEAQEFGLSIADYDATCICMKGEYPLTEGSLIWAKSDVGYKDAGKTIVDGHTADYMVCKVSESLNFVKYILKTVVK